MVAKPHRPCFSAEIGCIVLGYVQAVLSALVILMVSVYTIANYIYVHDSDAQTTLLTIIPVGLSMGTTFLVAVFLIVGVKKRDKRFVMVYLVSGGVFTFILFLAVIFCLDYEVYYIITLIVFGALMVYPMTLAMVFTVYYNLVIEEINYYTRYSICKHSV